LFSPKHNLTLPEMPIEAIENIVHTWQKEYTVWVMLITLITFRFFENKGSVMGCSNPHPHGQIWAQSSLPTEVKTQNNLKAYLDKNLAGLFAEELKAKRAYCI
jgi:UDPglucose--hexose-1-phosphate uridylyltransferase